VDVIFVIFFKVDCFVMINRIQTFCHCNIWTVLFTLNRVRAMVFNTTFNYISVISWRSVVLMEETRVPRWNHLPASSY